MDGFGDPIAGLWGFGDEGPGGLPTAGFGDPDLGARVAAALTAGAVQDWRGGGLIRLVLTPAPPGGVRAALVGAVGVVDLAPLPERVGMRIGPRAADPRASLSGAWVCPSLTPGGYDLRLSWGVSWGQSLTLPRAVRLVGGATSPRGLAFRRDLHPEMDTGARILAQEPRQWP